MSESHPYAAAQPWRFRTRVGTTDLPQIDQGAFARDIQALRSELNADLGPADLAHLRKMARWGRTCTVLGYALAWFPNPFAVLLLSMGNVARWTMISHHVMHRGYDRVPGVPTHFHSRHYARGWRRWIDWLDWMHPDAWAHEHNHLHHFHTGELDDPDLVEHNSWIIRLAVLPRPLKWLLAGVLMCTWKFSYYAPNTWWAWQRQQRIRAQMSEQPHSTRLPHMGNVWRLLYPGERAVLPLTRTGVGFWLHCLLPYGLLRFGLLPALFLPLGTEVWLIVLLQSLLAEVLANLHAFVIIVPNHAGDDVYRFDTHFNGKAEFYLRQVTGSVNYPGGSDFRDFLMGYLNYQIEHHVWPDLPMLKYRQAAPRLKAICLKHGVPYIEENVFRRFGRMWSVMMGDSDMRRASPRPSTEQTTP